MPIKFTELDFRQAVLGGVALLLILAHIVAPGAGVDAVSVILLAFLALVLYGQEITLWLAQVRERPVSETEEPELRGRVREIAYQVEHARVAAASEQISGGPVGETLQELIRGAGGEPRPVLLLVWGALEDRLREAAGTTDGVRAARQLAERRAVPPQFVQALDAFRALRNDVARTADGEVTNEVLWSLIDVAGGLLALVPAPERRAPGSVTSHQGARR